MDKLDITRAIKSRGFLVKDVAEKLGISVVAMSQRANKDNPTVKSLREVAEVIDCDIRDLFYKVDENGNIIEDIPQALFNQREDVAKKLPFSSPNNIGDAGDLFTPSTPSAIDDHLITPPSPSPTVETTTFCPHCGKKVRVGVVLLPEE